MIDTAPETILEQHHERQGRLEQEYNPIRGVGSPLNRFRFPIGPGQQDVFLPGSMWEHPAVQGGLACGNLWEFHHQTPYDWNEAYGKFQRERAQYDFEFWAATVAKIKNEEGEIVDFWLNRPQRAYLARLEQQRLRGEPVRQVVLKHRQWGATTLTLSYIAWHQIELYDGRDAWFVGQDKDASKNVLARYDRIREHYTLGDLTIRPYAQMQNTRIIPEKNATLSVGTVKNPNAPSGRTPQLIHLTEIGKWPNNQRESAEKLVSNMESMLVDKPGTVGIQESTMQGDSGTYFKKLCDLARKGRTSYDFWFASWTADPQYQLPAGHSDGDLEGLTPSAVENFVAQWSEYDEMLWHQEECSLTQINWYRHQRRKPGYVVYPHRLKEEFPTTANEAFQVGIDRVLPPAYVNAARQTCKEPLTEGRIYGAAQTGAEALEDITFEPEPHGQLKIWRRPHAEYDGLVDAYTPDNTRRIKNRYAMASDVGPGQSRNADYHDTLVLDRVPLLWGGHPEVVAEWHGHLDVDLYAWEIARLGRWYGNARWIIEVNSLNRKKNPDERDPEYGYTVVDEIKHVYGNLYHRTVVDRTTGDRTEKAGWHMGSNNKGIIVSSLTSHLRGAKNLAEGAAAEKAYIERNDDACNEMDHFVEVEGTMQAAQGEKDDRVDTRAMACHLNDKMGAPTPVEEHEKRPAPKGSVRI